jgi:hypothetical protein
MWLVPTCGCRVLPFLMIYGDLVYVVYGDLVIYVVYGDLVIYVVYGDLVPNDGCIFLPDLICFPESSCFESVETFIGLKCVWVLPEMCVGGL